MKHTWILIIAGTVLILGLTLLSTSGRKAPFIPTDEQHSVIATQEACLACHAPGKTAPLKPGHPPKEQCLICHKVKQAA